ncbi:hypothetical protein D3C85_1450350 [compost metagenome]
MIAICFGVLLVIRGQLLTELAELVKKHLEVKPKQLEALLPGQVAGVADWVLRCHLQPSMAIVFGAWEGNGFNSCASYEPSS